MSMSGNTASGSGAAPCGHPRQPGKRFCTICGQPVLASDTAETMTVQRAPARPGGSGPVPGAPAWQPGQAWVPEDAWPSRPERPWQPPAQPAPGQQGQFPAGPGGPETGPRPGPRPPRWPVVAGIIVAAALLGGGAGTYVLVAHPFSHPRSTVASGSNAANVTRSSPAPTRLASPPASASVPPATATPATTVAATPTRAQAEKQAATALAGLLTQSSSDRSAISRAYNDVSGCGSLLSQDQQAFQQAATSRQSLLSRLSGIPGLSSLPATMVADLTGAWRASEQVDHDYAQWAGDEGSGGCTQRDYTNPSYTAAQGPNQTATADKTAFTVLWNPLAQKYGLPAYDQSQV